MTLRMKQVLVLLTALAVTGCATGGTELVQVWKEPAYEGGILDKVVVIGLAKSDAKRRLFETRLAEAFRKKGVEAEPSYLLLPAEQKIEKEALKKAIEGRGFDSVLVTSLLAVDKEQRHVPGGTYVYSDYWGAPYHYGLYPYYNHSYSVVHDPGYTVEDTIVKLETNVYDVETETLIWAAVSETFNPENVNEAIDTFAKVLLFEMNKHKLVK